MCHTLQLSDGHRARESPEDQMFIEILAGTIISVKTFQLSQRLLYSSSAEVFQKEDSLHK